jgi:4-hydroxysphinganine ceramide fatty acyl 2-hydroxylase
MAEPVRTFTRAEVAEHCSLEDAWVTCGGYVHDVTCFLKEHPGGSAVLKPYLGRDVEAGMEKLGHSSYSYGLLKAYAIGVIEGAELRQHYQPPAHAMRGYAPAQLDNAVDFTKPTVWQVMGMGDKYWPWIESRPIVTNPMEKGGLLLFHTKALEAVSRYPWWYIWVAWPPVCLWQLYHGFFHSAAATYLTQLAVSAVTANATLPADLAAAPWFSRSIVETTAEALTLSTMPTALVRTTLWNVFTTFFLGMFVWSFTEYIFHRFIFHLEVSTNFGNFFHFFAHGIHHLTPTDSSRLTFPPLFVGLTAYLVHVGMRGVIPLAAPWSTCPFQAVFAGFLFAYTLYDTMHFLFHHSDFDHVVFRALKTAHMNHHYRNDERNFGVTSPLWDHVFRTWDPETFKGKKARGETRSSSRVDGRR